MSGFDHSMMFRSIRTGIVAAALGLGMMAGAVEAAPISPGSLQSEAAPIEKTVVVVHHHPRGRTVVHHRRRQVCAWHRGRRVCRWR